MQETSFNYIPMLIYELLFECLFNFVEKYMKQLVFRSIWPNLFLFQKPAPLKRNTERNSQNGPINRYPVYR